MIIIQWATLVQSSDRRVVLTYISVLFSDCQSVIQVQCRNLWKHRKVGVYFWEAVVTLVILKWDIGFEKICYIFLGRYFGYCSCFSVLCHLLGKGGWLFAGWCFWRYLPWLAGSKSSRARWWKSLQGSYMHTWGMKDPVCLALFLGV